MADQQSVQTYACTLSVGFYVQAPNREAAGAAAIETNVHLKLPGGELQAWPSREVLCTVQPVDSEQHPSEAGTA